jgi:MFS family permease
MNIRQYRDFMRIWKGLVVSNVGDGIHRIAILWWARTATGSDAAVVIVALASVVPTLLAAPIAGALVDRFPRRTLMISSDAIRLATSATLALLWSVGELNLGGLVVVAAVAAAASAVFDPALMASVTLLVPPPQRAKANSMIGGSGAVAGIVGPAIGGVVIGAWGTGAALWIDAATFLVSMAFLLASRIPQPTATPELEADHEGVLAGWALVRRDRSIRDLVMVAAALNLCAAPVPVLVVGLAAGPLELGGRGYGLLAACLPAGVLLGLLVAPRLAPAAGAGFGGVAATALGIAGVGALPWSPLAATMLLVAGAGVGVVNTILPTRFQDGVDPALQGRVFALVGAIAQVGRPVGLLAAAPLVAGPGVQVGLALCGAGLLAVGLVGRSGLTTPAAIVATGPKEIAGCQA